MINENTSQGDDEMSPSEQSPQQHQHFQPGQLVPEDDLSSSSSDDDDDALPEGGDPGSYSDATSSSYQSQMEQSRYPMHGGYYQAKQY